jgi:hypothetical protein
MTATVMNEFVTVSNFDEADSVIAINQSEAATTRTKVICFDDVCLPSNSRQESFRSNQLWDAEIKDAKIRLRCVL